MLLSQRFVLMVFSMFRHTYPTAFIYVILLCRRRRRTAVNTASSGLSTTTFATMPKKRVCALRKTISRLKSSADQLRLNRVSARIQKSIETCVSGNFCNSETLSVVRAAVGLEVDGVRSGSWADAHHSHLYRSVGSKSRHPLVQ